MKEISLLVGGKTGDDIRPAMSLPDFWIDDGQEPIGKDTSCQRT
ncbi:MAG: hypothetical protein WAL93_01850 [Desulfobacterales bacterium]